MNPFKELYSHIHDKIKLSLIKFQKRVLSISTLYEKGPTIFNTKKNKKQHPTTQHTPIKWFIIALLIIFLGFISFAILYKVSEGSSWEIAFWMAWQTFSTVGYGDFPAKTSLGRWITITVGSTQIITMSASIGITVALLEHTINQRKNGFMKNSFKDGYVLMNFPGEQRTLTYIHEIREKEPNVGICIVDNSIESLPISIKNLMTNIHFIKGSPLDPFTYEKARLKQNKVVIVFPKHTENSDEDGITKTIVDLVEDYTKEEKTRIIYVLIDNRNNHMFKNSKATKTLEYLEILSVVQECQDPYSAPIIEQLTKNTQGGAPFTVKPTSIVGMPWKDFLHKSLLVAEENNLGVNPLALIRQDNINLCPKPVEVIQPEDLISIVALNGFKWEEFEKKLISS